MSWTPSFPRCVSCERPVALRWRKCPWCKRWTGSSHDPAHPWLDGRLDALRAFGMPVALWIGFLAVLAWLEHPRVGLALALYAAALALAHMLLPWHAAGWRAAEVLWASGAILAAIALRRTGWAATFALMPVAVLALLLASRRRMLARLEGRPIPAFRLPRNAFPERGPCASCGDRGAEVVAPLYCLSAIFVTARQHGRFRNLCLTCARIRAIPATLVSLFVGWWGFPWGLVWTPQVVIDNLTRGGVTLESSELAALRSQEALSDGGGRAAGAAIVLGLVAFPIALAIVILPRLHRILGP